MKLERLDFKELMLGQQFDTVVEGKIFVPSYVRKIEPVIPPPPTFSEEQMLIAEREGYKKGFHAGEQEGRKQVETEQAEINLKLTAMSEQFAQSIAPLFDNYRQMVLQLQKDVPAIALAISRKVAGNALEANAETIVSELAIRCCETMINSPELTIVVNESLADTLESKLQELAPQLPMATHVVIVRDPGMPLSDCRIEWQNGSLERVTEQLWQQVEQSLNNMQSIAIRETTEQMVELQTQLTPKPEAPDSEKE